LRPDYPIRKINFVFDDNLRFINTFPTIFPKPIINLGLAEGGYFMTMFGFYSLVSDLKPPPCY
jgi:hypothetical protein